MRRPYNPVALQFSKSWTVAQIDQMEARYAALIDLIQSGRPVRKWRGDVHGSLIASAKRQGLISETAGGFRVTDAGCTWRESFVREPADYEALKPAAGEGRKKYPKRASKAAPRPSTIARDLVAAGLLFVHPSVIEILGAECFYLWAYSRTHRDLRTLDQLAQAVHWSLSETRIRVERCAERGYPLALVGDNQGEAA